MTKTVEKIQRLFVILLMVCGEYAYASEELFQLSLSELLAVEVNVSGEAVYKLNLESFPQTHNPLQLAQNQIPATINILTRKAMEARGMRNVVDVVGGISGITFGESPSEPYSFSIRGFDRSSVEVLYDGISMGDSNLNMRPMGTNNLEQLEIFKGPVVLRGTGVASGTINMIPRKASVENANLKKLLVSYGSFDSASLSADIVGSNQNNFGYLLNFEHRQSAGWVDRSESRFLNSSASFSWKASDQLTWIFNVDYFMDELPGYWGTPLVPSSAAESPNFDLVSTNSDWVLDENTFENNYNVADQAIDSDSLWLRLQNNWEISSNSRLETKLYRYTADRNWRNAESYIYSEDIDQVDRDRLLVTHERNLQGLISTFSHQATYLGLEQGFAASFEISENNFDREVGFDQDVFVVDSVDLQNPVAGDVNVGEISIREDWHDQDTSAVTLDHSIIFSERWSLKSSLRWALLDYESVRLNFDGTPRFRQEGHVSQFSYGLGLNYSLNQRTQLYAHHYYNHDSLLRALRRFDSSDTDGFAAPEVREQEVGIKSALSDEKLEWTLSVFRLHQTSLVIPVDTPTMNTQLAEGLDFSSRWEVTENINLGLSASYVDARYENYYDAVFGQDVSGKVPFNVPKSTYSLWASVEQVAGIPLEVGLNVRYVDDQFSESANEITLKGYSIANAFAAYTGSNYRVALHIRNIFDEKYVPFSEPFYTDQALLGAPRSLDLSLRYAF